MKQILLTLSLACLCILLTSCARLTPSPIEDGSYLTYEFEQPDPFQGGKTTYRFTIKFTEVKSGLFEVTVDFDDESSVKMQTFPFCKTFVKK